MFVEMQIIIQCPEPELQNCCKYLDTMLLCCYVVCLVIYTVDVRSHTISSLSAITP